MASLSSYLKPYRRAVIAAPLLMVLEVAMDLAQPALMATIVDRGIAQGSIGLIVGAGGFMVLAALIGAVGGVGCTYYTSIASTCFGSDLRRDLFAKVQAFSFANLDEFEPASLITRLTNDVMQVQQVVSALLRILVRAPLLTIGGSIMAITINPRLSIVLIASLPILAAASALVMVKGFPLFAQLQGRLDAVNAVMQENLTGVRVIKAFVRSGYERARFKVANDDLTNVGMRAGWLMGVTNPITILVANLSIIAVLWLGGRQVDSGSMHVGQVMALVNYVMQVLSSFMMLAMFLMNLSRAKASADRVSQVLDSHVDIEDSPGASEEPIGQGRVVFDNVSFRYKGAGGPPAIRNLSFTVAPGEMVAILGPTGAGKSTLVGLIPRFHDVTGGRITIDGRDIREIGLATLRSGIAMVLQESRLFSGTISENIHWGRADATEDEVVAAARDAQADAFITGLPGAYETVVGQRGVNLSGGQKQRLAIARALVREPKILILDDSTSAVDMGTEARLQAALRERPNRPTCFVIAQRISTVVDADRIVVLEDGELVGLGTHSELMLSCPVYQDIYRSQLGKEAM